MIAWIISQAGSYLAWALGAIVAVAGVYLAGRRDSSRKAALRDAKEQLKAHTNRERIENEIDQDTDLAARARRSGLVRPGK